MYQQNDRLLDLIIDYSKATKEIVQENFEQLVKHFEEDMLVQDEIENDELDLSLMYTPNWACIWNKIDNIDRPCRILQKNNKMALVTFIGDPLKDIFTNMRPRLYRLEDLSIYTL